MPGRQGHLGTALRLAATCLLFFALAGQPTSARTAGPSGAADEAEEEFRGSLDIRLHPRGESAEPPAELLLTDPRQRQTGRDPRSGRQLQEIPGSSYEQESLADDLEQHPGPLTVVLHIANPIPGHYHLEVIGREKGPYVLEIQALDRAMTPTRAVIAGARITSGAVDRYRLRYSNAEGAQIEIEPAESSAQGRKDAHLPRLRNEPELED